MTFWQATVLLFLVMDPLGNIPLFVTELKKVPRQRHLRVLGRELVIALVVMVSFLFLGKALLGALQVSDPALTAAGGVILLLIAIRMIFPTPERPLAEQVNDEPFIVPLAIPYSAGPSLLATEILLMSRDPARWHIWLAAVGAAWAAAATILLWSGKLQQWLGEKMLLAVERLMGMILVLVAVQMLLSGVQRFFG